MKKHIRNVVMTMLGASVVGLVLTAGTCDAAKKKKVKTIKYSQVEIACGVTYNLSKIGKDMHETGVSGTSNLKKDIKNKKVKWTSKSKNVKIKGKTITIKKPGKYQLTGTTKKKRFKVRLLAHKNEWEMDASQITSVKIRRFLTDTATVTDSGEVKRMLELLKGANFSFDYENTNHRRVGWTYEMTLLNADGSIASRFTISATSLREFRGQSYKTKNSGEMMSYILQLFDKYFVAPTETVNP